MEEVTFGRDVQFACVVGSDCLVRPGVTGPGGTETVRVVTHIQCITVMEEYRGQSLEELRWMYYLRREQEERRREGLGSGDGRKMALEDRRDEEREDLAEDGGSEDSVCYLDRSDDEDSVEVKEEVVEEEKPETPNKLRRPGVLQPKETEGKNPDENLPDDSCSCLSADIISIRPKLKKTCL